MLNEGVKTALNDSAKGGGSISAWDVSWEDDV
jgi:hypothetical protein